MTERSGSAPWQMDTQTRARKRIGILANTRRKWATRGDRSTTNQRFCPNVRKSLRLSSASCQTFHGRVVIREDRTAERAGRGLGMEALQALAKTGLGNPTGLHQESSALAQRVQINFDGGARGEQHDVAAPLGREQIDLREDRVQRAVHCPYDVRVPVTNSPNDIVGDNAVGGKMIADQLKEFLGGQVLRNTGAVAPLHVSIENDLVILGGVAAQEDAPVLDLEFLPRGLLKTKILARNLPDPRIDLHRLNHYSGIIMLEGPLRARPAQANHEHVRELRVPEPRHLKVFSVLEMAFQW